MPRNFRLLLIIVICLFSFPLAAQNYNGNSFYSMPGLGELYPYGNVRNIGMGGVGLSTSHTDFINNVNPALLHANKILNLDSAGGNRHSVFDASMILTLQNSRTSANSQTNLGATFNYFSYAIPMPFSQESKMHNRWTLNAGIQQFTKVAYKASFREAISGANAGDSALYSYNGTGGLYQVYCGNGFDITKNLSIGVQLSYIFGNRTDESVIQFIIPPSQQTQSLLSQKVNHNSIQIKPGIAYRMRISKRNPGAPLDKETEDKAKKDDFGEETEADRAVYFNIGLVSDFFAATHGKLVNTIEQRDSLNRVFNVHTFDTTDRKITIPSVYRVGISFDKPKSWSIGSDFSYSKWTQYSGFDKNNIFTNSYTLAFGGEKYLQPTSKNSRGDDAARKIVRAGFTFTRMPFFFNNKQVNDVSVSFGGSIPLLGGSKRIAGSAPPPKLNLGLIAGKRGSKQDNLLQEFYVKLYLGIVISDLWFLKSKVD